MVKRYDVIVIGAGLGGLSAATMLSSRNQRVLLLERHNVPGGYASSFVRGRYEFEISLHQLSGIGRPEERGGLYNYLAELGVADRVEFVPMPDLYRSVFPDLDVVLPVGREAYEAALCDTFPHEARGIRRFLQCVFDFRSGIQQLERERQHLNPLTTVVKFRRVLRLVPATWAQVLNSHVGDPRARAVLSQYWGYFGNRPSRAPFMYFAMALTSYVTIGPVYVKGRSQALSNAFIAAFEESGGEVRFNCGARKITTSNGRVTGVITEHDEEIAADAVVSNADPVTTCHDLIGVQRVPRRFFTSLRPRERGVSSVNVYLGVDSSPQELGFTHRENFVNASYDTDANARTMSDISASPGVTLVTCYNTVSPDISPPGTSMVVLTTLHHGEPWTRVAPGDYLATKRRVAQAMLRMGESICPRLRERAEVVEVGTPLTNMRYLNALGGAVYGFANTAYDHTFLRMSARGPLAGLFFAGASTQPGGGFDPCVQSGNTAAKMALRFIESSRGGASR